MILQCPGCKFRFLVPDQAIGASGRTVRCGNCKHTWFAMPAPSAQSVPDLDSMLGEINAHIKAKPIPPGSNLPALKREPMPMGLMLGTIAAAVVAMVFIALTLAPGIAGFPPSEGLALAEVKMLKPSEEEKRKFYEISGKILNTTEDTLEVSTLRVTLIDNEGSSLQYWEFSEPGRMLEPGKDLPFTTGELDVRFNRGKQFVVELGSALELALRRKPE